MKKVVLLGIVVYLITTGVSYAVFSHVPSLTGKTNTTNPAAAGKVTNDYNALTFDPNASKTEACPLTGVKYGKDQKAWWEKHRPLGVMIENHIDARPQSGINGADITYEAVAEGGITRTLNVFYCQDAGIVGPVRSARTYFLDFISEYTENPLYAHVGGANTDGPANALGQIVDYGWQSYNDLNQFSIGFPVYRRDESRIGHDVATEHTMYSETTKLWDVGAGRKLTNVDKDGKAWDTNFTPYTFKDAGTPNPSSTQSVHIPWDDVDYAVDWTYNSKDNIYMRKNAGVAHMDRDTHKQLQSANVVVLFMKESHANDGYENNAHMLYGTKGTGDALVFSEGKETKAKWSKADRQSHLVIADASGKNIVFTPGKIWFEVQGIGSEVTVH